jgi:hypothetical protein
VDVVATVSLSNTPANSNSATLLLRSTPQGDGQTWTTAARKGSTSGGLSIFFLIDSMVRNGRTASIALTQDSPGGDIIQTLISAPTAGSWTTIVRARTTTGIGNTTFGNLETAQLNAQGHHLFRSVLQGTDAPQGTGQTYWLQRGSQRLLVIRQGANVPNSIVTEFVSSLQSAAIADDVAGSTPLAVALTSAGNESVVFRVNVSPTGSNNVWTQIYRAPLSSFGGGSRGGALLAGLSLAYNNGALAFVVEQKNASGAVTGEAILRSDGLQTAQPIARSGTSAGPSLTFANLEQEPPAVFEDDVAFRGTATQGGPALAGVWWQTSGTSMPALVALAGTPASAEGLPAGATWVSFAPPRLGPTPTEGNTGIAFMGTIAGPGITSSNNLVACFADGPSGALRVIARKGDTIDLPGGGTGVLADFGIAGRGTTESINQTGLTTQGVLLVGSLTDGRTVVLRAGEPTGGCDSIDFNRDGLFPDDNDLVDLLVVLAGGTCSNDPNCGTIDFNGDGLFPDDNDLVAFLCELAGGATCCN